MTQTPNAKGSVRQIYAQGDTEQLVLPRLRRPRPRRRAPARVGGASYKATRKSASKDFLSTCTPSKRSKEDRLAEQQADVTPHILATARKATNG